MAEAKIPKAADASKHKAGGGNVEICQQTRNTPRGIPFETSGTPAAHCWMPLDRVLLYRV